MTDDGDSAAAGAGALYLAQLRCSEFSTFIQFTHRESLDLILGPIISPCSVSRSHISLIVATLNMTPWLTSRTIIRGEAEDNLH